MLLPQYSIRWILGVTAVFGLLALIGQLAVNGTPWAAGVSVAMVALAVVVAMHALCFGGVWLVSTMIAAVRGAPASQRSPFRPATPAMAPEAPTQVFPGPSPGSLAAPSKPVEAAVPAEIVSNAQAASTSTSTPKDKAPEDKAPEEDAAKDEA